MAIELPDNLDPKQQEAIASLLTHPTVKQAASAVGIGERTLHRWLVEDQAFIHAYHQARRIVFQQAIAQTQRLLPLAINTLGQIMADKSAPHSARVSAATAVTRFSRESIELDDLAERVAAIEQQVINTKGAGP
jgi:uncharacterized protein (UPF0147 family)